MSKTPAGMVKRYLVSAKAPKAKSYRRIGRHAKDGRFLWWGTPLGLLMRRRKVLRGTIAQGEVDDFHRWAAKKGLVSRATEVDPTPRVTGKEDNVHAGLLGALNGFMARHAPRFVANIISGFRSYASQLRLYLGWVNRLPGFNPANPPGSSKHEASGGFKVARAADTYIAGVPFWTWCARHGLRDEAHAAGLRQPYPHEPWHVEKAGL